MEDNGQLEGNGRFPPCNFECLEYLEPSLVLTHPVSNLPLTGTPSKLTQCSCAQRLQSSLRSFLSRFTQGQLSAILSPQSLAHDAQHVSPMRKHATYHEPQRRFNSARILEIDGHSSLGVGQTHLCGCHDGEDEESEEPETISECGTTKPAGSLAAPHPVAETSNTDRFVQRAFDGIESTINSRWAWKDLPQQLSQCSQSLCKGSISPGTRLVALRSRLRNEQHMAIALDRVAAVLFACMRDDLGESFQGPRSKGNRVSIIGNRLLAEQLNMSRNEVLQEIRGSLPYCFAHDMISPGIILLLGARSQDM